MKENSTTIAAFDFDGTLTTKDSLLPFLIYSFGVMTTFWKLFLNLIPILGYVLKIIPRQTVKEVVLTSFFKGMPIEEVRHLGEKFAQGPLQKMVIPDKMKRFQWHLDQGHRCYLISASIEVYITPWAKKAGFHDAFATKLTTTSDGLVTGKIEGLNCRGPEKTRRLLEVIGNPSQYTIYAYGNSDGDRELLALADHSYYKYMP